MQAYDRFVDVIVEGRDLSEQVVRDLADGRLYSGENALTLGLIDGYANLYGTIERAAEIADIDDYEIDLMNDEDVYYSYQAQGNILIDLLTSSGLTGGRAYLLYV